tara:strand:- start:5280 stop:6563 length:1284 start_codon:yes stop_codon:yes gene_type:complete
VKKKIFLIGLNLYSIILSLKIKKDFKSADITILEGSKNFLNAYSSIKIGSFKCNPGFHALENIRSKNLVKLFKKMLNFKKINKTRGLLIGDDLISFTSNYSRWPQKIKNLYKLKNKSVTINRQNIINSMNKKYLKYLKNNIADERVSYLNSLSILYPWFFSPNYKLKSKDEGEIFNQKIRDKKIKHSFLFPEKGLFENISIKLKKYVKNQGIKIKLKNPVFFEKKNNQVIFHGSKELNNYKNFKIICIPVVPLSYSIKDSNIKLPKLKPIKFYSALIEIRNCIKSDFDNFSETIVSSEFAYGLRRISLYSEIVNLKKRKIYQIEFIEHKKIKNIDDQIKKIMDLMSKFILFKKKKSTKNIKVLGVSFIRNIFSPEHSTINNLSNKTVKYFKNNKNIFFPRQITWPINSNKHMLYAMNDYTKSIKKII